MILAHLAPSVGAVWIVAGASATIGLILGGWLTTSAVADHRARADRLARALRIIATLDEGPAKTAAENALTIDRQHR